jgi:hypothetical protein
MSVSDQERRGGLAHREQHRSVAAEREEAPASTMLPERRGRAPLESAFVRVVATAGVVGIGVALGAILSSEKVAGWITGLVVALVSVLVSGVLWSSRRL